MVDAIAFGLMAFAGKSLVVGLVLGACAAIASLPVSFATSAPA